MKLDVKVSIIIPVFNVENFISETIESVLNQSLTEVEVILVDDGSTDTSVLICEKFLQVDNRLRLIKQGNLGVSVARNNGLNSAIGEYVYFLDSDDTIDSEFLSTSYEKAKFNDADITVVGNFYCKRIEKVKALPTCAMFIKHNFLKKYDKIRFPVGVQPCEDGLFSHQILQLTNKIVLNNKGIYYYREHENQNHLNINKSAEKVINQIPKWFEILYDFYNKYDLWKTNSLELAKFIEHEPFEFRYLSMNLNDELKMKLHLLISNFMNRNVIAFLNEDDIKELNPHFLKFINCRNYKKFDINFKNYFIKLKILFRLEYLFLNLNLNSIDRKNKREKLKTNYEKNSTYPTS